MAAKRRYRIVGQLGSNRRLAAVGVEAALLYLLALPYGDREGRLFGEAGDLIDEVCPAFARRHGWSEEFVDKLIEELVRVGLWERWPGAEGRVVGICRWHDHQHPSRLAEERPSTFADPPPSPNPSPEIKPSRSEANRITGRNRTEPDGIVRNRTEPSGSAATAATPRVRSGNSSAQRLIEGWRSAFAERNAENPDDPIPTPGYRIFEMEQIAEEVADALAFFPDERSLVAEIRRLCRCFLERGLVLGPVALRQLGKSFPGTSTPDPAIPRQPSANGHDGGIHPSVAARLPKIGKELPA